MEGGIPPEAPVSAGSPADRWTAKLIASRHQLLWTQRRFICRRCKCVTSPSCLAQWLQKGVCSGAPVYYKPSAMREEKPLFKLRKASQQVIETVVPLLPGVAQAVADLLDDEDEASEGDAEASVPSQPATSSSLRVGPKVAIHESHVLANKGVWTWCCKCGFFTQGTRIGSLRKVCAPPTPNEKQYLARIKKGLPPHPRDNQWE